MILTSYTCLLWFDSLGIFSIFHEFRLRLTVILFTAFDRKALKTTQNSVFTLQKQYLKIEFQLHSKIEFLEPPNGSKKVLEYNTGTCRAEVNV